MSDVEITGNESFEELEAKLEQLEREEDEVITDDPIPGGQPAPAAAPATTASPTQMNAGSKELEGAFLPLSLFVNIRTDDEPYDTKSSGTGILTRLRRMLSGVSW